MKIKNIIIQGFRGFNEERNIDFHDHLTLIHAPNSYGKTSISEAFEWLDLHKDELQEDWHLAEANRPLKKIAPLEGT